MNFLFIFSVIVIYFYLILKLKKSLHMLQQNWYNDGNRYLKWIFKNMKKSFNIYELLCLLLILGLFFIEDNIILIIITVLYLFLAISYFKSLKQESVKKPLVITKRIKRLMVTTFLIYFIPLAIYLGFHKDNDKFLVIYYLVNWFLVFVSFFIIWMANIINKPIEKQVFHYYRRKAVSKLKNIKNIKVVGITGSYGKTSSKNILADILNVKLIATPTPKNFNTTYGLIQSINDYLDKFSDVFIAEMGAFKTGEIKELCDLVNPQYGILTKIGVAHLESFGSQENILKAKFELIESLPTDGIGVLNKDDELQVSYPLNNDCRIIWIGIENQDADVIASNITISNLKTKFNVKFKDNDKKYEFETRLLGKANIYNILAGIALGREFGISIEQLQASVKMVNAVEHRLELKKMGNINIIDDAYNSNPIGSKMALEVLNMMPGKKIVVTPGMIDLGEQQEYYNKEFGKEIALVADEVVLIGVEQTKPIFEGLISKNYPEDKIHILNDIKKAFTLINELKEKETFVLLENDLPDIFNE